MIIKYKKEDCYVDMIDDITINGDETNFQMSEEELIEFAELLSEIWSIYLYCNNERKATFDGKRDNYNYSKKNIVLTHESEADEYGEEVDTTYYITICDKTMIVHRYAEWIPDRLEYIFFILCKGSLQTNSTNFKIQYQEYGLDDEDDYITFIKPL